MYHLLSVVLILLGVYLVTRVLYPLRERLEPTTKIKAPTAKNEMGQLVYSPDEIDRIWSMVENPDAALPYYGGLDPEITREEAVYNAKNGVAMFLGGFYSSVYSRSQGPITMEQIKEFTTAYIDPNHSDMIVLMDLLLKAYFIDQADPPTPAPSTPEPAPAVTSTPAPTPPTRSTPAPIDVTGPTTITINVK